MLKIFRVLAGSALMAFALSACASIETRDLPKCSGHDRRPLNADLWAWQDTKPNAQPGTGRSESSMGDAASRQVAQPQSDTTDNPASVEPPRWNVAASKASCGEGKSHGRA